MTDPISRRDAAVAPAIAMAPGRVVAVDLLRGVVMIIMALDHTRDFVHAGAMNFRPDDLTQTTIALFLTRWVTHFCAPAFMLCAGLGAWFRVEARLAAGMDPRAARLNLSRYLVTRGLWLIVLEFTVVRIGFFFQLNPPLVLLLVFWALGLSMIALAGLIWLPPRAMAAAGLALVALHNLTDGINPDRFGAVGAGLWRVLHQQSVLMPGPPTVIVAYPLVPWIGVMALGFCLGYVYRLPPDRRRRLLLGVGLAMTVGFVVIRAIDIYGDPLPWSVQPRQGFTILSFLNTTKYPPSLAFLLMTLGPALMMLGWCDRGKPGDRNPCLVFGRTPLFYFVWHIPLIHAVLIGLTWWRYGAAPFLFLPPPTLGTARDVFPPDFGWSLGVTYLVWGLVVIAMYPLCVWIARLKARRRDWWLGYV